MISKKRKVLESKQNLLKVKKVKSLIFHDIIGLINQKQPNYGGDNTLKKKMNLTLHQKLMLGYCGLLFIVLVLLGVSLIPQRLHNFDTELDERLSLTARILADDSNVIEALQQDYADSALTERLDALAAETENIDYIVLVNEKDTRVYHPNHTLIGQQFAGGDETDALNGSSAYLTTRHGTEASQRRAFHTVCDESGNSIGFVMVSAALTSIQVKKRALLTSFALVFALALAVGLIVAWLIARSVRRSLLGHEPSTFARMFLQREEILDHLNDCLIAISPDGSYCFGNAQAKEIFGKSELPETFPLWSELRESLSSGQAHNDLFLEWAEHTFLAKIVPLGEAGALLILRDRTEYTRLDQQLTGTNHVIEALRANTHEYLNKLHVILGLLQIGETQMSIQYIEGISSEIEGNYQTTVRQLQNRTVAALILGKSSHARELGIQFSLRPDSTLPAHSAYLSSQELVTIIGNLIENAFDAVKNQPDLKQVGVFIGEDTYGLTITVDDTGHGMTQEQIDTVRKRQYTTKGDGHGFGLRLIQQIVANRQGYLEIESEPGEGSAFTINFSTPRDSM